MDSSRAQLIEDLFHRAADLPHHDRVAFLTQQCGEDTALLAAVEALLLHDVPETTESPLRSPVAAARRKRLSDAATPAQIGHYRIVTTLGSGGMGVVYEAEQLRPVKRTVAVKVIKLGMDTHEVIARFEAERQALAVMEHPGIARVYDAGATETGRPYFVMELVRGVPITRYCDDNILSTRQRLELFIKVCDAVQHAHTKGIIHRDLKPGNILVTEVDGVPAPKVIDFGIAKATLQRLTEHTMQTKTGQMLGTPEYMSPEQARAADSDVDTRSDVYSLGAVLYELLSGSQPFETTSLRVGGYQEIVRIIRDTDPPRPSTRITRGADGERVAGLRRETAASLSNRLRRELEWIPLKAMRKEREARYRSTAELADDVRAYLAGRPLVAAPESRAYRVRKFLRRHQRVVAALAAMLVLLVTGIITTSIQAIRATRAQRIARQETATAEQRFNDVRALARGMLFDVQDQVLKLPGSQDATRKIVDLSKEYLEKLQAEKSNDPVLIADVASAYGRLGDIQGGPNFVSANNLAASRKSWETSMGLANRALELAPRNPEPLRAAAHAELALADIERVAGNLDAAGKRLDRSLQLYTTAAEVLPDSTKRKYDVILVQTRIAGNRFAQNKIPEAIRLMTRGVNQARALLGKEPDNRDMQLLLANGLFDLSLYRDRAGDAAGAEQAQGESLARHESLLAADPHNARYERLLAANYLTAFRRAKDHDDPAAQERYLAQAMQHARKLAAADSTSAPLQFLLADVLFNESDFRFARKEYSLATQSLNESIAIYEKLIAANANDRRAREMLSVCYGELGEQLEAQEKYDDALAAVTKASETFAVEANADGDSLSSQAGRAYYDRLTGQIQLKAGHVDAAAATLRRALAAFEHIVAAAPQDVVNRRNELAAGQSLAEALIAMTNDRRADAARRESLRSEAVALLKQARDGYALLLTSPKPLPADSDAVKELNQKIDELENPSAHPQ